MSKKLLVVFGSTGQQGSSIISHVLSTASLSSQFSIRAITRDVSKPSAISLQSQGVELVQADLDDPQSIALAVKDAHTVFAFTATIFAPPEVAYQKEYTQGKTIADAAVAAGAKYLIWSSSMPVKKISGGKLTNVFPFDVKADVEAYIRTLPIPSAFFTPPSFMQNLHGPGALAVRPLGDGTCGIVNIATPETLIPFVDPASDSGKFVGAILANQDKYAGKVFVSAVRLYSMKEIVDIVSKVSGKEVRYVQIEEEAFRANLPESMRDMLTEMMVFFRDFGYCGSDTRQMVDWTVEQVGGPEGLTSLEGFLRRCPLKLE